MELEINNNTSFIKKVASGIVALVLVGGVSIYLSQEKNKKEEVAEETTEMQENENTKPAPTRTVTTTSPETTSSVNTTENIQRAYDYKDGIYKATGTYTSPGGTETVEVSLTLTGDIVTKATFKGNAELPASKNWQGKFTTGFEQAVVGKDIDTLALTIVNGSSLTPKGFMDAVATIKKEAKL